MKILSFIIFYFCFLCVASAQIPSGECGANGNNLTWVLEDGTLTISGAGSTGSKICNYFALVTDNFYLCGFKNKSYLYQ